MTVYTPDNWVILEIKGDDPHYRVLAGWSGGYTTGSSWRMNSGITGVEEDGDYLVFRGSTGSEYRCHKEGYGLRMNNAHVFNQMKELHGDLVEMMDDDCDWFNVDWLFEKSS